MNTLSSRDHRIACDPTFRIQQTCGLSANGNIPSILQLDIATLESADIKDVVKWFHHMGSKPTHKDKMLEQIVKNHPSRFQSDLAT